MTITTFALLVAAAGGVGGVGNCLLTGERYILPCYDEELKVRRPGWIGIIFIGALAAFVVWAVYGPLASFDLNTGDIAKTSLPLIQLGTAIIAGLSGGKILTSLAQQKADQITKKGLAELSKTLNKTKK